jgi:metallo-beta-lactamase class B
MRRLLALTLVLLAASTARASDNPDWRIPLAPFQIADNLYYVGSRDLASYLITTPRGNILINANLETSPPQIRASVEALGFKWADTKILLNGQGHFDHMAGAAEIIRETNAKDEVMDGDVSVVRTGGRTDFLAATGSVLPYPPARVDRILHDGDTVTLGDPKHGGVILTAHKTAGHTRGCTTWTLRAHLPGEPAGTLRNIVIVGGVAFWSDFHFVATPGHPASYPGIAADFAHTFATLHALPCDVFLGAHGVYFNLLEKLPKAKTQGPSVWIDPAGYKAFIDDAQQTFETALAKQKAASK